MEEHLAQSTAETGAGSVITGSLLLVSFPTARLASVRAQSVWMVLSNLYFVGHRDQIYIQPCDFLI